VLCGSHSFRHPNRSEERIHKFALTTPEFKTEEIINKERINNFALMPNQFLSDELQTQLFISSNENITKFYAFVDCKNGIDGNQTFSANISSAPTFQTLQYAFSNLSNFATNNFSISVTLYLMPGEYNASSTINNCILSIISNSLRKGKPLSAPDVSIVPNNQSQFFLYCKNVSISLEGVGISNFTSTAITIIDGINVEINGSTFKNNKN
jgi:hypothetical protein